MDYLINNSARVIRQYLQEISFSITAVVLMLGGPLVNDFVKRITKKLHWLVRYFIFIMLCTIGYGSLTQIVYKGMKLWLVGLADPLLIFSTVSIFMGLAWLAKQQKEI